MSIISETMAAVALIVAADPESLGVVVGAGGLGFILAAVLALGGYKLYALLQRINYGRLGMSAKAYETKVKKMRDIDSLHVELMESRELIVKQKVESQELMAQQRIRHAADMAELEDANKVLRVEVISIKADCDARIAELDNQLQEFIQSQTT